MYMASRLLAAVHLYGTQLGPTRLFSKPLSFSVVRVPIAIPPVTLRLAQTLSPACRYPSPWRHARNRNLCMVSERQDEGAPMPLQSTSEYGATKRENVESLRTGAPQTAAPSNTSSTSSMRIRSSTTADGEEDSNPWLFPFGLAALFCLTFGSIATASGFVSSEKLLGIARWFEKEGPNAIYLYGLLYFMFELIAVPALPLTLGSGYLFGLLNGTVTVSIASTLAATTSFLIARYGLRASISRLANRYTRFRLLDRAIGKEGFKFVLLLRLSPVLPFAISNYLYGLTSVKLGEYVLASWLGMLPGTIAYVSAGAAVSALTDLRDGNNYLSPVVMILGLVATVAVLASVGAIARKAVENVEEEEVPLR